MREKRRDTTNVVRRERILLAIAGAFVLTGALALHLTRPHFSVLDLSLTTLAWILAFTAAHAMLHHHLPGRDPLLLPSVALLTGWGLLLIGRLAPNFLLRQIIWLGVSVAALGAIIVLSQSLRWLRRFRYTWLLGGLLLLATTLIFGVNPSGYGPRLWLGFGSVYLQPSEPLKLLMIIFLASYLAERRELLLSERWKVGRWYLPPLAYVGPLLAMFGLAMVLLAWQQDLGAAMLFFFTALVMLYLSTRQWGYVAAGLALFLMMGGAGYAISDHVALRVDTWLTPWPDASGRAFQIVQSLLAFGSGGVLGAGIGQGTPTYIPAVHTDFTFAAIGEEFGLLGTLAIIALYAVLALRGIRTAARTRPIFERLLAGGLTAGLVIQAWVIMAGNVKLIPIAGVTLPFVSYGGSSLLSSFVTLGLLLRISDASRRSKISNATAPQAEGRNVPLRRLASALLLILSLLALSCGYWSVARAEWLVTRQDNPRQVAYEQRVVRGRILDREGVPLADVEVDAGGIVTRTYPVSDAAPVVGYATIRYGTGGVEAAYDGVLRGEAQRSPREVIAANLLHRAPQGQDVQLTVDAELQRRAQQALADARGAAVLLDARSGEILALASSPTFDPAYLEETWEALRDDPDAPLVNRATQGLYQPGGALETLILAEAVERQLVTLEDPAPMITRTVPVDGLRLACQEEPRLPHTFAQALQAACPAPFAALGARLETPGIRSTVQRWALTGTQPIALPTDAPVEWTPTTPPQEAIGQGDLTVTPLQMALVAATLVNHGITPTPRLILRVQSPEGVWQEIRPPKAGRSILTPRTAKTLREQWMPYEHDTRGHLSVAVAGEERPPHAWFLATHTSDRAGYAIAVLLEHTEDPQRAQAVGLQILEAARLR
jgi:cell division protein FtsW (lipid II flippase)